MSLFWNKTRHCGMKRDVLKKIELKTDGMEFAIEMIAEVSRKGLRIGEVSVPLRKSVAERHEKLRTVRDGFRHLWFILRA